MSDPPAATAVFTIRLTPAVLALLKARAESERRTYRALAGILIEDGLTRQRAAGGLPTAPTAPSLARTEVTPRFKVGKGKGKSEP